MDDIVSQPEQRLLIPELAPPQGPNLSATARLLLGLLRRLCKKKKATFCYASHDWLAGALRRSITTIKRCLEELHTLGYVHWTRTGGWNRYDLKSPAWPIRQPKNGLSDSPKMAYRLDDSGITNSGNNNTADAVAERKIEPEEGAMTQRQPIQGTSVPAAEPSATSPVKSDLIKALVDRGLSESLARQKVSSSDPALIREILEFHRGQKDLRSPVRALRSMLENPAKWEIERTETGWRSPAPDEPREDRATHDAKLIRQRQEREERIRKLRSQPYEGLHHG
jgi:hypothetical protein